MSSEKTWNTCKKLAIKQLLIVVVLEQKIILEPLFYANQTYSIHIHVQQAFDSYYM